MQLSICHTSLQKVIDEPQSYYYSVLAPIAISQSPYLIVDNEEGDILETYKPILMNDHTGMLMLWLDTIISNKKKRIIQNKHEHSKNIHVNTLSQTFGLGPRILLSNDTEAFLEHKDKIADFNIDFLDIQSVSSMFNSQYPNIFCYQELTQTIIKQLSSMLDRKQVLRIEDFHNDELSHRLESDGYTALDQTRRGTTGQNGNPGELDILIKSSLDGTNRSIIEALRESSCGPLNTTISKHLNKLINDYDTCGLKVNYLITYCEAVNFEQFWTNYKIYIGNINSKPDFDATTPQLSFIDTEEEISNFADIRVGRGVYNRNGRDLEVYHIVANLYVRPPS